MKKIVKFLSISLALICIFTASGCSAKNPLHKAEEHPVIADSISVEGEHFHVTNIKDTTVEKEYEPGTMPTFNIIKNKSDYDTFINQYNEKYKLTDIDFMSKYTDEYFKTHSVIFIKTIETKNQAEYSNISLKDDSVIEIARKSSQSTNAMEFAVIFSALEIENAASAINNTNLSINYVDAED